MKILIVPPEEFIPIHSPLSAIFQYHQARALHANGIEVAVISVEPSLGIKPLLISFVRRLLGLKIYYHHAVNQRIYNIGKLILEGVLYKGSHKCYTREGIRIFSIRLRCWSDIEPREQLLYFERCARSAFIDVTKGFGRPDIIHAHNAWLAGTAASTISAAYKIPYCITEHSTFYARKLIHESFYPLLKSVYSQSASNLFVSESLAHLVSSLGLIDAHYRVLPNILDPVFEDAPLVVENDSGELRFLNVAELTEKKGHAILLHAFAQEYKHSSNVRLVITGDGDLREKLEKMSVALGISGQVEFTGQLDRYGVLLQTQACDIFVLPSIVETFGVVVIEAHSCGKPVIATACGGPENIIQDGNGMLVPTNDIAALGSAMKVVAENLDRYKPEAIRASTFEAYGSKSFLESISHIYSEVLAK